MATYQRVALFILFDSMETDLISHLRAVSISSEALLTQEEREKALPRLQRRESAVFDPHDDFELVNGLDLGDKFHVLLRHRDKLSTSVADYFLKLNGDIQKIVSIRNATMHGRPLTTTEYATGFAAAESFIKRPLLWPSLNESYRRYASDPHAFLDRSVVFLERDYGGHVALNNLPIPDYEDTGFVPRPTLERELKKKILSRHPVITVLGEGGSGKSALALQTLYGMLYANDHNFDAIVWVSAKSSKLTEREVERIEGAITSSLGIFEEVANTFEPGTESPEDRVYSLLDNNKILLVIDNLETVIDDRIREFAESVPGDSKILFTSRVPLGHDLSVHVDDFTEGEARSFIKRLADSYGIQPIKVMKNDQVSRYLRRLGHKPIMLKWFALGINSGLDPDRIVSNPEVALRFCIENIVEKLSDDAQRVASALAVMPTSASAAVIEHVAQFNASAVELALSELSRFSLIEVDQKMKYERSYILKPLIKSYITRVLGIGETVSSDYIRRYRQIEGMLQNERDNRKPFRYDRKSFTVRSRSEAIAAAKLRIAYSACRRGDLDTANKLLNECKIAVPDYFEVYRTEAFISYENGDVPRANLAYETALELADNQPQLHFWYSGFLQRALSAYAEAAEQLDLAHNLDPERPEIVRESARVRFFMYDFKGAQSYIDKLKTLEFPSLKDEIIAADLEAQLYAREADHLSLNGDYRGAIAALGKLFNHLNGTDDVVIDRSFVEHVSKVIPVLDQVRRSGVALGKDDIDLLEDKIYSLRNKVLGLEVNRATDTEGSRRAGELREKGRQNNFGFIREPSGVETFVHSSDVGEDLWREMCEGRSVTFELFKMADGKLKAVNIELREK